jgi:DNA polymerase III subunit beta
VAMKLTIEKSEFLKGLSLCHGIAEKRSTMPILSHVVLSPEDDQRVYCRATDLNTTITCHLEAKIEQRGGVAVNARSIFEIVKNLPTEQVDLQVNESHHVELRSGSSRFKLMGLAAEDFPEVPKIPEQGYQVIPVTVLLNLINRTLFSVSQDETRQHLSGVLLEAKENGLRMVSTDGHRLSKAEEGLPGGWPTKDSILIPKKGLQELKKMLEVIEGDCEVAVDSGVMFVRHGALVMSIRLIDSRFPPYEKVIPASSEKKIVVDRMHLIEALKRVSLMSEDRNKGVRLIVSGEKLSIESDTPEVGEAKEDIEIDYEGEVLRIGFNATYIIEALSRIDGEEVILEFNEELDPCVVRPIDAEYFLGVVMPLRL